MKLPERLVEDVDFIVVEKAPPFTTDGGVTFSRSKKAWEVYAPPYEEKYLCVVCQQFLSTTVKGINAHQAKHKVREPKVAPLTDDAALRIVAFNLLPVKMQNKLLVQARQTLGGLS